ncbi:MAG: hypothetical protein KBG20_00465 [Caldilineaceae bacterium]|nr:hypothetical protein [Caldilineaceae bacterium]MBP8108114.1 hypothetical protein [Caldilineaceae bacterium]MBP8123084.1 hypothetical protein [Caldilineaceae bacterium]MBP9070731.1 hypothetical protein [Caldilineaceae bacterium]
MPTLPTTPVERAFLLHRLDAGLADGRTLTLISAPAGYGKSIQAAAWAAHTRRPVAWLSLDESDDTPLHFFTYLIAALQRVDPALGTDIQSVLAAGQFPPPAALMTGLVNDLTGLKTPCLCVLDDFQSIQDPTILAVLQGLLAHPPATFHLVLVTREDPALPLARLRASNQLTEIRAADLRFDEGEIGCFLRESMGVSLSAPDLSRLAERTEGWIAGLQLAGLSLQGRADPSAFIHSLSGSHRFILSYLTEEVLKVQPPPVQRFLLQTAILSRFTGALCDAVTDETGSATLLEALLAANLFLIPLDDEGRWYRYHHLFAELLRHQLQRTQPETIPALHRRASHWYASHDRPAEAIEHSLVGEDFARSVELIETHGWKLLNQGYARRMEGWIQSLPAQWRDSSPRTNLDFAWMHLLRGQIGEILPYLGQAQAALTGLQSHAPAAQDLRAECLALQANLLQVQGNLTESVEVASAALALAEAKNQRVIGLASLALGAAYRQIAPYAEAVVVLDQAIRAAQATDDLVTEMLAFAHLSTLTLQFGRLRFLAEICAPYRARLERRDAPPLPVVDSVQIALGALHYWWNRLDEAQAYLAQAVQTSMLSGHTSSAITTRLYLSMIAQATGDWAGADGLVQEAADLLSGGAPGWVQLQVTVRQAELRLFQGDLDVAEGLLRSTGIGPDDEVNRRTDRAHLVWLRLLATRDKPTAVAYARRILASAVKEERHGATLRCLIIAAPLLGGDEREAWLAQAVALAAPEGNVRVFVDEGPALAALAVRAGYTELAAHFPTHPPSPVARGTQTGLVEPMSERELEVLALLGQGLKYAEIADELVVSLNTVRFHVKSIYGKLGVNRQTQAVQRAQEIGLL